MYLCIDALVWNRTTWIAVSDMAYFEVAVLILYYCNMRCVLRTCLPIGRTWRVAEWHHDVSVGLRTWNFREAIHTPACPPPSPPLPPPRVTHKCFIPSFAWYKHFPQTLVWHTFHKVSIDTQTISTKLGGTQFLQSLSWHTDNFYKAWWNTISSEPVMTQTISTKLGGTQFLLSLSWHTDNSYKAWWNTISTEPVVTQKHFPWALVWHTNIINELVWHTFPTNRCVTHKQFLQSLVRLTNIFYGLLYSTHTKLHRLSFDTQTFSKEIPLTHKRFWQSRVTNIFHSLLLQTNIFHRKTSSP